MHLSENEVHSLDRREKPQKPQEAQREGDKVAKDKAACEADAERIGKEKALAEIDLAKAQPFVDKANKAIASIKPKDIQEIKANKNPTDIIKMIFDCNSLARH